MAIAPPFKVNWRKDFNPWERILEFHIMGFCAFREAEHHGINLAQELTDHQMGLEALVELKTMQHKLGI